MDEIIQGSPEWFAIRCGKVTASRVADVMAKIKSGEAAARKNYRAQLVAETLTGTMEETFSSAAMQWGIDTEAEAREHYATNFLGFDQQVSEVGFVNHPDIEKAGASPDGLVGEDGLVEIKCPNTAQHIEYILSGDAPKKYLPQMQWQMACTGRKWCDFVSYDPRLPGNLACAVYRVMRDDEYIISLEVEVVQFLAEVHETVTELQAIASDLAV